MANLFNVLAGAGVGYMTGGPAGAVTGGLSAMTQGGSNAAQSVGMSAFLGGTQVLQNQAMAYQLALDTQNQQFNEALQERAELMRESNELRDVAMAQRKADDQIVKKYIETIGG